MSNSSKTTNLIPINEGDGFETEADSGLVRLIVGSQHHAFNWRTGKEMPLQDGEIRPFPLTHPNLIVQTGSTTASHPDISEKIEVCSQTGANRLAMGAGQRDECADRNRRAGEQDAMQRFSISNEDYEIQALAAGSVVPEGSTGFGSEKELAKIAGEWPMARLVEIWNGLTGVTAVRKFKDRGTAVNRIWKQIQSLTPPPPLVQPEKPARAVRTAKKKAKGEAQPTERGKQVAEPPSATATGSAGSKKAQVIAMLDAVEGVSLAQIMEATGWQKHSVRGFLSGMIGKKMGLKLLSFKGSAGDRVYRIER